MARNTRKSKHKSNRHSPTAATSLSGSLETAQPANVVKTPKMRGGLIALGLLIVAIALYCALLSYDANDRGVIGAIDLSSAKNPQTKNLLGPVGAFSASVLLFLFGAAAWLVPMGLFLISLLWLLLFRPLPTRSWVGFTLLIISASCWLALQPWLMQDWSERWNVLGRGGAAGYLLGGSSSESLSNSSLSNLMQRYLGRFGGMLISAWFYLVGLILLSSVHPYQILRAIQRFPSKLRQWQRKRNLRKEEQRRSQLQKSLERESQNSADPIATVSSIKRRALRFPGFSGKTNSVEKAEEKSATTSPPTQQTEFPKEDFAPKENDNSQEEESITQSTQTNTQDPESHHPAPQVFDSAKQTSLSSTKKRTPTQAISEGPDFAGYTLPSLNILAASNPHQQPVDEGQLLETQQLLIDTFDSFGVSVSAGDITRGPTVTRYEIYPSRGLRVNKLATYDADLARATCAERVNILAPIPGKATVGIELANSDRTLVTIRELLEDDEFLDPKKEIPVALGKDVYGKAVVGDLAAMPHLLVAGATGSGKSVCINSIISSILFRFSPDDLRFLLIDPKVVEMQLYNRLPHLIFPVITEPKKVILALRWVVNEMERRYRLLGRVGVRNLKSFNKRDRSKDPEGPQASSADDTLGKEALEHIERIGRAMDGEDDEPEGTAQSELDLFADPDEPIPDKLPFIVVIIDELADLMQSARADVEGAIQRITQKARAAGIHLIVATQTPRAEVITGTIKANIPSRIAFAVSNKIDSRVILDSPGAEKLVGKGDLLFINPRDGELRRSQGCYIEDEEVEELVAHCYDQAKPQFSTPLEVAVADQQGGESEEEQIDDKDEEMLKKCIEVIINEQAASTSLLQRRLSLGYTRAARMMDLLEQRGYVGPQDGAKRREILIKDPA